MGEQVAARSKKKGKTFLSGLQLSWLERTPDKREVGGSSPLKPTSEMHDEEYGTTYFATKVAQSRAGTLFGPNEIHFRMRAFQMNSIRPKRCTLKTEY